VTDVAIAPVRVRYERTGSCEISVGGHPVPAGVVTAMTFRARAKEPVGTIELTFRAPTVEVEGAQRVRVDPETHDALVALGWTPPAAEAPPGEATPDAGS
jgi:hypothetical protein